MLHCNDALVCMGKFRVRCAATNISTFGTNSGCSNAPPCARLSSNRCNPLEITRAAVSGTILRGDDVAGFEQGRREEKHFLSDGMKHGSVRINVASNSVSLNRNNASESKPVRRLNTSLLR